jgi:thiamine-monophosphate kinase
MKTAAIERCAKGMIELARRFNVNIVGGDISRAQKLTIDVAMTGLVEKKFLTLRSGAKPGDIIMVTGPLGGSIRGKHCTFTPRVREARLLVRAAHVHAMIDISDGLSQDLEHVCRASNTRAFLYEDLIPLHNDAHGMSEALTMGEDFELLFCVARKDAAALMRRFPLLCLPVGEMARGRGVSLVTRDGRVKQLTPCGWRHF